MEPGHLSQRHSLAPQWAWPLSHAGESALANLQKTGSGSCPKQWVKFPFGSNNPRVLTSQRSQRALQKDCNTGGSTALNSFLLELKQASEEKTKIVWPEDRRQ